MLKRGIMYHAVWCCFFMYPVCCLRHCPNNEKALFHLPWTYSWHRAFGQVEFLWQIRIYSSGWQMVKSDPSFRRMALNCTRVQRWGASHLSSPHMDCFVIRQLLKCMTVIVSVELQWVVLSWVCLQRRCGTRYGLMNPKVDIVYTVIHRRLCVVWFRTSQLLVFPVDVDF